MSSHRVIGTSVPRVGADRRVLGRAKFAADVRTADELTAMVFRSDRPHALIRDINVSEASAVPGCVAVLTAEDVPGTNRYGIINKDQRLLADDKVRFVGDPVALVVAESPRAAEKALSKIRVDYQDLPAIFDPEDALRPGAPDIHEGGNAIGRRVIRRGNPDAAFASADIVIERVYTTSFIEHTYLEPDAGLAHPEDDGTITIYASTQNPHYDRKDVADLLGLDEDNIRVIQAATGGGFGSKLDLNVQGFLGLATLVTKRPVRMVYSREEVFLATAKRHPLRIRYKSAADSTGRLLAADVRIVGDTGAYASYALAVSSRAAVHATGPYDVPNVHIESILAYTNNPMAGAMRGFGVPQLAFAHESQTDLIAQALGIDPLDIRLRNCMRIGSTTATGQQLKASVGIGACLKAMADKVKDDEGAGESVCAGHIRKGRGYGVMMYGIGNTGMRNPSTAQVELNNDGTVTLFTGAADIGQGSCTVLKQIAAEALGLEHQSVKVIAADTGRTTNAGATSASRQTYISGNAVADAATKLKEVLLTEASMMLKVDSKELTLQEGTVSIKSNPDKRASFSEIAGRLHKSGIPLKWQGYFDPETVPLDPETGEGIPYATYAFACHAADVEVDTLTGEVRVTRVIAAHDVGTAVNPTAVRGQIYSGVAMGIGLAIMEEHVPGSTESMKDYHIPTAADMPRVEALIIEDPEPTGPFGAKGVGEPALIPTAPAVLNAVANALGVRIYDLPANLERTLKACRTAIPC